MKITNFNHIFEWLTFTEQKYLKTKQINFNNHRISLKSKSKGNIMKLFTMIFILLIISFEYLTAQSEFSSYYSQNQFGITSPGAMKYGLYGYDNPAVLATVKNADFLFTWSDQGKKISDFNYWGIFGALPNFGFGAVHQKNLGLSVTDYRLTSAFGNERLSLGFGYGWSSGDKSFYNRSDIYTIGSLFRPNNYFSVGLVGNFPTKDQSEVACDLAIRPFGNEWLSVFGDYAYRKTRNPGDAKWSVGAAVEPLPGLRLTGRYFDNKFFNAGVQLSFGRIGLSVFSNYDKDSKHASNVYGLRIGEYDRNLISQFFPKDNYVNLNLLGGVKYQKYKWFDNSNALLDLLSSIKAAKEDKSISGIAINLSGFAANRTVIWELRKQLEDFKSSGKKIVVYLDQAGIKEYHLASVADKIVMDPLGMLTLEGFLFGKTYFKGTLEKLGVGFTELRYFKYKSAVETYARAEMSEGDREQWGEIIDDLYNIVKQDVCRSRNISHENFDNLVDNFPFFTSEDALKNNLVDSLGRWEEVVKMIELIEGEKKSFINFSSLEKMKLPEDNFWGRKPEIAVIYALGACAVDEGITARKLVKDVDAAVNDENVKAIVLRVDSPGGSALASDIIAEAIKKAKGKKPVIVSQGYVAGSGGYWLSMYGDTIVAAPNTITGSIGVIGGFYYNKDLKDKLGITTDFVKKGKHADLGFGFTVPLLGISLPDRNFNEEELSRVKSVIKGSYKEFVTKVSTGRHKTFEEIDSIGQGRVWSGLDAMQIGLVDVIGNLSDAIDIAVNKSGLKGKVYRITESPEPGLFNISSFIPKIIGIELQKDEALEHLRFRLENNGKILHLMPLEDMDILDH
jgi:protease-4